MAIRTFNSVGGFSVGENPETIILANGDITTDFGTFTANLAAGNVLTNNLLYANGTAWDFQLPAGANYEIQYYSGGEFGASSKFTWDPSSNVLTANGNISTVNISANGNINTSGNMYAANFVGNVVGNISGNITLPGSNTFVVFNDGGVANSVAGFTFDKATNAVSIAGNITSANANLGNLTTSNYFHGKFDSTSNNQSNIDTVGTMTGITMAAGTIIQGGNLVSANYITGTLTTADQANITKVGTLGYLDVSGNVTAGNITGANLIGANYFTGTLTTNAQPNITSLGTLTDLTISGNANVTGNVNAGNLYVNNRVTTSLLPSGDNTLNLGNGTLKWSNLYVSNILIGATYIQSTSNVIMIDAANTANNMSAGSLTVRGDATLQGNATISGNLTVSGNTTYINVTTLDIKDPLISMGGSGNGANATSYDGKDRGMVLLNYTTGGTPHVENQAFVWKTGNGQFEAFSNVTYSSEVIDGANSTYGNIKAATFIGDLSGTILTNSQTNITTVGTLGNLTISSNLQVNNTANINSLKASGITYPSSDGSNGQYIATYGNGQLFFSTISTSSIVNGDSNVVVSANANVTISSAGNANILTVTGTGVNVAGTLNTTGTLVAGGNATVANLLIGNSTLRSATVTTTSVSASQTIVTFPYAGLRGAIFDVKGEQAGGGKYSIATVSCVHNGTDVDYAVYGTVLLGGATGALSVNLVGSNLFLSVTPTSSNSTVWTTQYRTI